MTAETPGFGGDNRSRFAGLLRLTTVRFRSERRAICGAVLIDNGGFTVPSHEYYSISFPAAVQAVEPRAGQTWHVTGRQEVKRYVRGGNLITEIQVIAKAAEMKRPSGDHVVQMLATSDDFPGIGTVTAQKLWNAFGEDLYHVLEEGDEAVLSNVVGAKLAAVVVEGWKLFDSSDALAWLHRSGIEPRLSRSLLQAYGSEVRAKLQDDPYRTLAFGMSWSGADQLATAVFGLQPDDPRRLAAAVEYQLYAALDAGHTAHSKSEVVLQVATLIGQEMAGEAVALALAQGAAIWAGHDLLTSPGMEVIERGIAEFIARALQEPQLCSAFEAAEIVKRFELNTAVSMGGSFDLNDAQRDAVAAVALHGTLLITGGAGVGKTTVLRAVVALLDHVNSTHKIMAISGRAARRAAQSTGKSTSTIAGYLRTAEKNQAKGEIGSGFVLIVDEASMLDVLLAWRLFQSLPAGSRVILIGDPAQLPPVGPGLTLHAMVGSAIPRVELTQERRFGGEIAVFSREIRKGNLPRQLTSVGGAVALIEIPTFEVVDRIVELYLQDSENSQILAFVRSGDVSCESINRAVQRRLVGASHSLSADESRTGIKVVSDDGELEYTGLRRLDKVICNVNLHEEGLQNGSLGQIVEVFLKPVKRSSLGSLRPNQLDDDVYAIVKWDDGEERPVVRQVLDAMELAYCITTHKSQGSQFDRVLVACNRSRLLDRAIVYTAVTRAAKEVQLVGDIEATREAVAQPPKASARVTTLAARLSTRI